MLWLNFIHLYQPANSPSARIKEAVEKSYLRLTQLLEDNPDLHFTANISACLLERLREDGFEELIKRWRHLISSGRLEVVGSAAYHAFLPLVPESEAIYQIKRQEELLQEILGIDVRGGGFFFPEMAYTPSLAKLVKTQGYRWIIIGEASLPDSLELNPKGAYLDANSGLQAIVRQRRFSNAYAPDLISDLLKSESSYELLITATDAELYGLRHEDPTLELEKMAALDDLQTQNISAFLDTQTSLAPVVFRAASWETNWDEDGNNPFFVWHDRSNKIQTSLWRLAKMAMALGDKYRDDKNYEWYRWHLSRGLASCSFWWASGRDFFHNFGPVAWNPDEVENGINDLLRAIRSLQDRKSLKEKVKAEKLAAAIRARLWQTHWRKFWTV
ncbi:MAG: hypothetical protein PHG95_01340 [Patescibacteria group bacterium]|nr:hypothetical protein [Patescibacteria group bacterium]